MPKFRTNIRTKRDKEEFAKRMNETIALRTLLVDFYNKVYRPTLNKFNGKVLNKRLITALNKAGETQSTRVMCALNDTQTEITFKVMHSGYNYNDVETLYTKIETDCDGRILFNESVNHKLSVAWLKNFKKGTRDCAKSRDNYDTYLKLAKRMQNLIQEYGDLPSQFRYEGVDGGSFSTYLLK